MTDANLHRIIAKLTESEQTCIGEYIRLVTDSDTRTCMDCGGFQDDPADEPCGSCIVGQSNWTPR